MSAEHVETPYEKVLEEESPESKPTGAIKLPNAKLLTAITIVGGFFASVIGAIGHHIFLSRINDHDVAHYSEFWMRNISNGFATLVGFLLGLSVTCSLTQGIWRLLATSFAPIGIIDNLFALPSPISIVSLLFQLHTPRILLLLLIAIYIQLLVLVGTFAPNALTVGSRTTNVEIPGPSLNLSQLLDPETPFRDNGTWYLMKTSPEEIWTVPPQCESACTFQASYVAPALSCKPLDQNDMLLQPYNSTLFHSSTGWNYYDSSWTWTYDDLGTGVYSTRYNVSYIPFTSHFSNPADPAPVVNQTGPIEGYACKWIANVQYQATFSYKNSTKTIVATPTSQAPIQTCTTYSAINYPRFGDNSTGIDCGPNTAAIETLTNTFIDLYDGELALKFNSSFNGSSVAPAIEWLSPFTFINDTSGEVISLQPSAANVGQAVEDSFTNLVLTVMLQPGITKPVLATVEFGSVWKYSWRTLLAIYLPSLLVALLFVVFGVYLILTGHLIVDPSFSTYFIITRTPSLIALHRRSLDALKQTGLYWDDKTGQLAPREIPGAVDDAIKENMEENKRIKPNRASIAAKWGWVIIIVMMTVAIVLAAGHHLFLTAMDGRDIRNTSQFWIKNASNAFAQAVAICLSASAGYALIQLIWNTLSHYGMNIDTIDQLFSLPSPKSIFFLLPHLSKNPIIVILLSACIIQALFIVPNLAPNALTTSSSKLIPASIDVLTMNLSRDFGFGDYFWQDPLFPLFNTPLNETISVPAGCGAICSFEIEYAGPALQCRDLHPGEQDLYPRDPNTIQILYDFTTAENVTIIEWNNVTTPSFILFYTPATVIQANLSTTVHNDSSLSGAVCSCVDATYKASFHYANRVLSIATKILSYGTAFSNSCDWSNLATLSQDCHHYSENNEAICRGFIEARSGDITYEVFYGLATFDPSYYTPFVNWNGSDTWMENVPRVLSSKFADLKEGLVQVFANTTLGLLPLLNQTTTVPAEVWDGRVVWSFSRKTLWSIYGPALFLVALVAAYGLYCIRLLGMGLDMKFSTIMTVTGSEELDGLYAESDQYEDIIEKKLIFDKQEERFVVSIVVVD